MLKNGNFDPMSIADMCKDPEAIDGEILKEVLVELIGNNEPLINEILTKVPNFQEVQAELKISTFSKSIIFGQKKEI